MFERFTDHARQVVVLAQEEARLMRHGHIGTEHLLIGLARVDDDVASPMLHDHGLTGEKARAEVVAIVGIGNTEPGGQIPFTPAAHDALEATLRESLELGHDRVEPAHLLLGVLRQRDGVARRVLSAAGANPPEARAEVVSRLEQSARTRAPDATGEGAAIPVKLGEALIGDLGHPQVDGELLLALLERDGAVAAWLRERGVDEHAVRRMLGEP
jgi:ATP-dependent Clp protease ATP-binding subunit ClpC